MRKIYYFPAPLIVLFVSNGCALTAKRVVGNGQVITENRRTGAFEELVMAGSIDVYLTQGPVQPARVEAESNITPYVEITRKDDDKLVVRFRRNVRIETHRQVKVYLTAPHVEDISAVGSGKIRVQDTLRNEDEIRLNIAGSGNIELQMNAPEADANIAGSGDIIIGGQTRDLDVNILGSGNFRGAGLKSEQATVKIAGSGDAQVYASIKLDAKILGSGSIYYAGDPSVTTKQAGSGSVVKR